MNFNKIKDLVEKWTKWSAEKQLKIFMKNSQTKSFFKAAVKWGKK